MIGSGMEENSKGYFFTIDLMYAQVIFREYFEDYFRSGGITPLLSPTTPLFPTHST